MENKMEMVPDGPMEGLSVEEARELKRLLSHFMKEYGKKPDGQSDEDWLKGMLLVELPGLTEEEAAAYSQEAVGTIQQYAEDLSSMRQARTEGRSVEDWYADKIRQTASGLSAAEFSMRVSRLDAVLDQANTQMQRVITTQEGAINCQMNLDGFIAEQQHVNVFNAAAEVCGSPYRAEVCAPGPGETYGKNSFDVVIREPGGRIVHQYQMKYGRDAQATINMLKRGNYNNQTLVVPAEQVAEVQAAFPGKTVVAQIGGTEKVPVSSAPLTKKQVKELQNQAQQDGAVEKLDWGVYDNQMLVKRVAADSLLSGIQGAAIATGFHLAAKVIADEPVDTEEVVSAALDTGADTGIKTAAAGALKVASERGFIEIIPPGTPMRNITAVVCIAIANVKTLKKVVDGQLTWNEALDEMGCNTAAMYYGLSFGAAGTVIGAAALSWIPIVGPVIGGAVGGMVGYMAGSKVGESIFHAAKDVVCTAKKTARAVCNKVKNLGHAAASTAKNLVRKILG